MATITQAHDTTIPLSLHPDLPDLDQTSFVFTGAHLVPDMDGLKSSLHPAKLDGLLAQATEAGWSRNLLDGNARKLSLTFDDGRRLTNEFTDATDHAPRRFRCGTIRVRYNWRHRAEFGRGAIVRGPRWCGVG